MLALMYSGDMCYWMWESSGSSGGDTPTTTSSKTATQAKKVQDSAAARKRKKSKEGKGQDSDNTDNSSPSAQSVATPSTHSDSSHLPSLPDTACDKSDGGNNRTDGCEAISASSIPSNPSIDEVTEKLESVEFKSTEASTNSEKNVTPSQETEEHQAGKCEERKRTPKERAHPMSDLYQLIQRASGEGVMSRWVADFEPHKCGQEMLSKYIDAARGPLKGHGWEYSRAVKLMVKLKKADALSSVK